MSIINYTASATGAKFHNSDKFQRFMIGPVGSGKTSAAIMELLLRAMRQEPDQNGIRRTKSAVIRNTLPELKTTTIPSIQNWLGPILRMNAAPPIQGWLEIPDLGDGTKLEHHMLFLPLDSEDAAKKLLSLEITYAFIDEFAYVPEYCLEILAGRVGRFPPKSSGCGPTWYGMFGSSNPPSTDHWSFQMYQEKPSNSEFFFQPPGLLTSFDDAGNQVYVTNPAAENVENLPKGYYENLAIGKDFDYIKVFIQGEFGEVRAGQPVFTEYKDHVHCLQHPPIPDSSLNMVVGIDVGIGYNSAVFLQYNPIGQVTVYDELLIPNRSITSFVHDFLKPHIINNYGSFNLELYLDPAAQTRSASDGAAALDIFRAAGLQAMCAVTNNWTARKEAVVAFLTHMADGRPGFLLSPNCLNLRKALISSYKYDKVENKGESWLKDRPVKNRYSHVADALQYACLAFKEFRVRKHRGVSAQKFEQRFSKPASMAGY